MRARLLVVFLAGGYLFALAGCSQAREGELSRNSHQQAADVSANRYELHDVQDGAYHGTVLLDKQTGRVWQPITINKGETLSGFQEVDVTPTPSSTATKTKKDGIDFRPDPEQK